MEVGRVNFNANIDQLSEAIHELSAQVQRLRQADREESEKLMKYRTEGTPLEFTLITGGLIEGRIQWIGNRSLGVKTDSEQSIILYKHAIAFIQKQMEQ